MDTPSNNVHSITDVEDDDSAKNNIEAEVEPEGSKPKQRRTKASLLPESELEKMVAESMRDVDSDDDDDSVADDVLLAELRDIVSGDKKAAPNANSPSIEGDSNAPPAVLPTTSQEAIETIKKRIVMYTEAEALASKNGDACKERRFARGLKTLNDLLEQASAGSAIDAHAIPPELTEKLTGHCAGSIEKMRSRKLEYDNAALQARESGDNEKAEKYLQVAKKFDSVISMSEEGKEVDLSDMPPSPDHFEQFMDKIQAKAEGNKN